MDNRWNPMCKNISDLISSMVATVLPRDLSKLTPALGPIPQGASACGMLSMRCSKYHPGTWNYLVGGDISCVTRCRSWAPEVPLSKLSLPLSGDRNHYRTVVPLRQGNLSIDLDPWDAMSLFLCFKALYHLHFMSVVKQLPQRVPSHAYVV